MPIKLNFNGANASLDFLPFKEPYGTKRNKKAEALLRKNIQERLKEEIPSKYTRGTNKTISSGGLSTTAEITKHGGKGKTTRDHMIDFGRNNVDPYERYDQPVRNMTPERKALRSANIKYQAGQILERVQPGDTASALPLESDSGRNPRAKVYDRMTKGALKGMEDDFGEIHIQSKKGKGNKWTNMVGEEKSFDPKKLKEPLTNLAKRQIVRRLAPHPVLQGAMFIDDASASVTGGKKLSGVGKEWFDKNIAPTLREQLKKGHRITPVSPLPYGR